LFVVIKLSLINYRTEKMYFPSRYFLLKII